MRENLEKRLFKFSVPKRSRYVQRDPDISTLWHVFVPGVMTEHSRELKKIAQEYDLILVERERGYILELAKKDSSPVVRVGIETVYFYEPSYEKSRDLLRTIAERVFKTKISND